MRLGDAIPGQKELAQAALDAIPNETLRAFYQPHYRLDKDYGKFVGLVCKACNRWQEYGHAKDCPATTLLSNE